MRALTIFERKSSEKNVERKSYGTVRTRMNMFESRKSDISEYSEVNHDFLFQLLENRIFLQNYCGLYLLWKKNERRPSERFRLLRSSVFLPESRIPEKWF